MIQRAIEVEIAEPTTPPGAAPRCPKMKTQLRATFAMLPTTTPARIGRTTWWACHVLRKTPKRKNGSNPGMLHNA